MEDIYERYLWRIFMKDIYERYLWKIFMGDIYKHFVDIYSRSNGRKPLGFTLSSGFIQIL